MFSSPLRKTEKILSLDESINTDILNNKHWIRLARAVFAFGINNIDRIRMWTNHDPEALIATLENKEFLDFLAVAEKQSDRILPGRAEVYSLLTFEAENAERSADRLKAMTALLGYIPEQEAPETVTNYVLPTNINQSQKHEHVFGEVNET